MPATLLEPAAIELNLLLNYFVDLCLLRARPQDLPASSVVFALTAALNVVVGALLVVGAQLGPLLALSESLFEVGLMLAVLRLALIWQGKSARFPQTASAIMGSSALLGLVALPLLSIGSGEDASLGGLLLLMVVVWSIVVMGHIVRHAFELTLGQGSIVALLYTIVSFQIIVSIFPVG